MTRHRSRRALLGGLAAAGVTALAGCLGGSGWSVGSVTPTRLPLEGEPRPEPREPRRVVAAGRAVDVTADGRRAVVSERRRTGPETVTGSVAVLECGADGWTRTGTVTPPDGTAARRGGAAFGRRLAGDDAGERLVVARDSPTAPPASVYLRAAGGWRREGDLPEPERDPTARTAGAVAFSRDGRVAAVGLPAADDGAGAVTVHERTAGGWARTATVRPAGPRAGRGVKLADDGDRLLAAGRGRVAVLDRADGGEGWTPAATLRPPADLGDAAFGRALATGGDGRTVLVGAPGRDGTRQGVGAVIAHAVAPDGSWERTGTLEGRRRNDFLGATLCCATDGRTALAGRHPGVDVRDGTAPDAAVVLDLAGGPGRAGVLHASPPGAGFGAALALDRDGTTAVVGAPPVDTERAAGEPGDDAGTGAAYAVPVRGE